MKKRTYSFFFLVQSVYTKPVDSVFRALRLAAQNRDSICYLPPSLYGILRASFPSFLRKKDLFGGWLCTVLAYTKRIIHLSVGEER